MRDVADLTAPPKLAFRIFSLIIGLVISASLLLSPRHRSVVEYTPQECTKKANKHDEDYGLHHPLPPLVGRGADVFPDMFTPGGIVSGVSLCDVPLRGVTASTMIKVSTIHATVTNIAFLKANNHRGALGRNDHTAKITTPTTSMATNHV